jgi:teichuronic acid biosynthesis glycosyltransferase TuaC
MRIAYLCKCRYMGHDVISHRYARLYEQPRQLARRGHDVLGLCLSYRAAPARDETHPAAPGRLRWVGLAPGGTQGLDYPFKVWRVLRAFHPDLLVGASDCPVVVLAAWFASRLKVPFAADLYDQFESFGLCRVPGLATLYRRALCRASAVTCVSEPLAEWVRILRGSASRVVSLPSTIDRALFYPRERLACRAALGLPRDARLLGTAGTLSRDKGIAPLYLAFQWLADGMPDLHLVLAGAVDPAYPPPAHPRVRYLGRLSHSRMAELFGALDVGVVYLRDTPYGHYSFPQKAYEMAACRLPLVVAQVGSMAEVFAGAAEMYQPDNAKALAGSVERQFADPRSPAVEIPDWTQQAVDLEALYLQVVGESREANSGAGGG